MTHIPHIAWPHWPFTLTTFLATWGAILSSVTFGWNLLRDLRDKAKLTISANVRAIITRIDGAQLAVKPELLGDDEYSILHVVISFANVGRRPLRLKSLGGLYKEPVNGKRGFVVSARDLPKTLAEAEAHDEYTDFVPPFTNDNLKELYVSDSFGREWKLSGRQLRQLRKDCKQYASMLNEHGSTPASSSQLP